MSALSLSIDAIKPLNRWDHSSIRPGVVGSVGDCLLTERLKSSLPGDFRWEASTYGKNESKLGSNVQDGYSYSYTSHGGGNRTKDSNWGGRRRFETSHGWVYQDLRAPDKFVEPILGSTGRFDWDNRIAKIIDARDTGKMFVYQGGVIPPNGVTRGGTFPEVTDVVAADTTAGYDDTSAYQPNFKPDQSSHTNVVAQQAMGAGHFRSGESHVSSKRSISRMR